MMKLLLISCTVLRLPLTSLPDKNATVSAEDMDKRDLLIRNYITMYPKDPLSTQITLKRYFW